MAEASIPTFPPEVDAGSGQSRTLPPVSTLGASERQDQSAAAHPIGDQRSGPGRPGALATLAAETGLDPSGTIVSNQGTFDIIIEAPALIAVETAGVQAATVTAGSIEVPNDAEPAQPEVAQQQNASVSVELGPPAGPNFGNPPDPVQLLLSPVPLNSADAVRVEDGVLVLTESNAGAPGSTSDATGAPVGILGGSGEYGQPILNHAQQGGNQKGNNGNGAGQGNSSGGAPTAAPIEKMAPAAIDNPPADSPPVLPTP
ncbi:MAG TPA: hypothetical protein VM308_10555, partial [Sphingomicrobium sp.]|nr:hypothetical protein [Sphingomicrobium sp.]